MNNTFSVKSVVVEGGTLDVTFSTTGHISKYFNSPLKFHVEYSEDIEKVPVGIAIIPFVCNVLPIVWLTDSTLELPEIDNDFYRSIDKFKQGYVKMYPMLDFKGKVSPLKIIESKTSTPPQQKESSAAFFGGGVDAFATLIAHIAEKPTLMTLWGSDIPLKDTDGWEVVKNHTLKTAENFGLQAIFVKTNFRELLNYIELNRLVKMSGDNYWHGFQHGIGIIGHAAPLAAKNGFSTIYIASSYPVNDNTTCASHPDIDGNVRFAGCNIIHDQYEYDRQAKVDHICSFSEKLDEKPHLRVCWVTTCGNNCCRCEKCLRTMCEIFATGQDPHKYSFNYTTKDLRNSKMNIFSRGLCISSIGYWEQIKLELINRPQAICPDELEWIKHTDFEREIKSTKMRAGIFLRNLPSRIINKIKHIFAI